MVSPFVVTASRFLYHDLRVRSTTNLSQDPARSTFYVLVVHDEVVEDEEPMVCTTLRRREMDSNHQYLEDKPRFVQRLRI